MQLARKFPDLKAGSERNAINVSQLIIRHPRLYTLCVRLVCYAKMERITIHAGYNYDNDYGFTGRVLQRRDWENPGVTQLNRLADIPLSPAGVIAKRLAPIALPRVAQPEW